MLAQRQRELYSQQHRQRQLIQQQRAMLMRQQSFGNNLPPSSGLPVQMGNPRLPQGAPQQFPYPPNYGTNPGTPPASTSPFSQLAANPEAPLANRSSMVNRGMTGNMGGQFGTGITPQMQQNVFQYPGSGMRIYTFMLLLYVQLALGSHGFHSVDSTNPSGKYPPPPKKKIPESSSKQNLNSLHPGNYLYRFYIAFTCIRYQKWPRDDLWRDAHGFYFPILSKVLEHRGFLYL